MPFRVRSIYRSISIRNVWYKLACRNRHLCLNIWSNLLTVLKQSVSYNFVLKNTFICVRIWLADRCFISKIFVRYFRWSVARFFTSHWQVLASFEISAFTLTPIYKGLLAAVGIIAALSENSDIAIDHLLQLWIKYIIHAMAYCNSNVGWTMSTKEAQEIKSSLHILILFM